MFCHSFQAVLSDASLQVNKTSIVKYIHKNHHLYHVNALYRNRIQYHISEWRKTKEATQKKRTQLVSSISATFDFIPNLCVCVCVLRCVLSSLIRIYGARPAGLIRMRIRYIRTIRTRSKPDCEHTMCAYRYTPRFRYKPAGTLRICCVWCHLAE